MAFEYLEHEADIGIKATADTLEEAFEEGGMALFNSMVDIARVEPIKRIEVEASADSVDSLFVEFLNTLLAKVDTEGMVFSRFRVKIEKGEGYRLNASAWGEPLDQKKHDVKTEVKAATYHGLKCWSDSGKHHVQCVLDI
jgi:SHS2 domain-containing protein